MRVSRSFTPLLLALTAGLLGSARLEGQTCTSQPLGWGERSLGVSVNDASIPGGVLGTRGKKDGAENLFEFWYQGSEFADVPGIMGARWAYAVSFESDAKTAARAARPNNAKGPMPCLMMDWLATGTSDYSQSTILLGFGYAFGNDNMSLHAIPEIGYGDKGVGMVLQAVGGATIRSGKWFVGSDLTMPLNTEGATVGIRFRGGFTFGQAVPPKGSALPTQTTQASQPAPQTQGTVGAIAATTMAGAAATQSGAAAPTTTTSTTSAAKPYSIDDITGMLANSLTTTRILDLSKRSCINFKMTEAYETRLRRAGAEPELLDGLKKTCYAGL